MARQSTGQLVVPEGTPPQSGPAWTPAQDPLFREFASQWFDSHRHAVAPRSVEDYRWGRERHLLPICTGMRAGELLALRWSEVDLPRGTITVAQSKTEAGSGREIDIWPELGELLVSYRQTAAYRSAGDHVFATATGKADTRSNIAKRLKRAVTRANANLAEQALPAIASDLSPHSLRRTFASLLYLRGENPVYVMQQMGHSDPKLALRIYTRVTAEQRRRGPAVRLLGVLDGARWTDAGEPRTAP
jgi:integrase